MEPYDAPQCTAEICCPRCGCEATTRVIVVRGAHATGVSPKEPDTWTGQCPECRLWLISEDLDMCDNCHIHGRKVYSSININALVCAECKVEEIEAEFA